MDKINNFQRLRNQAKTLYGIEVDTCFQSVISILNRVQRAYKEMALDCERKGLERELSPKMIKEFRDLMYDSGEDDCINKELLETIKEIEYNLKDVYTEKNIKWKKLSQRTKK